MLLDPANRTVPGSPCARGCGSPRSIEALSKGTGRPLAEYQAALKNPAALGPAGGGQGQRRGIPVPGDVRVRARTPTPRSSCGPWSAKTRRRAARRRASRPANAQRMLTVASIVEAEARRDADRGKVARVIYNRLDQRRRSCRWTPRCTTCVQQAAAAWPPATPSAPATSPLQHLHVTGPAGRADRQPGRAPRSRPPLSPTPGPWLYFVDRQPRHRRDAVRRPTPAEHRANAKLFHAWCSANKAKC